MHQPRVWARSNIGDCTHSTRSVTPPSRSDACSDGVWSCATGTAFGALGLAERASGANTQKPHTVYRQTRRREVCKRTYPCNSYTHPRRRPWSMRMPTPLNSQGTDANRRHMLLSQAYDTIFEIRYRTRSVAHLSLTRPGAEGHTFTYINTGSSETSNLNFSARDALRSARGECCVRQIAMTVQSPRHARTRAGLGRSWDAIRSQRTHKGHPFIADGLPAATRLQSRKTPQAPSPHTSGSSCRPHCLCRPLAYAVPGPQHCRLTQVAPCGGARPSRRSPVTALARHGARPSDGPQTVLAPVAVSFCQNWCVSSITLMVYSLPTAFSFNPKEFCGLPSMTL